MSLKKSLGFITFASLTLIVAYGCSSSSTTNNVTPPKHDAGHDSGMVMMGNDSGMGGDTNLPPLDGNVGDTATPPPACLSTMAFTPTAYVNATAHQGLCAATDIAAFVAACGDNGTQTTCDTWQNANVAGDVDGAAGTACGNCILAPMNNGGTWTDPEGFFSPNYGACLQILDATNGVACATAFDNANGCIGVACDTCQGADFTTCDNDVTATGGSCATYLNAEQTPCMADFADGGAAATCSPGGGMTLNPDLTFIIGLVCGSADGG